MKKMKYILPGALILNFSVFQTASAAIETKELLSTGGIADLALLIFVFVCLLWSMRVMSLVRGGLMSKSWQMFTFGFVFLLIARILVICENMYVLTVPEYVSTILYLLMVVTWLVGIYQTKKILA